MDPFIIDALRNAGNNDNMSLIISNWMSGICSRNIYPYLLETNYDKVRLQCVKFKILVDNKRRKKNNDILTEEKIDKMYDDCGTLINNYKRKYFDYILYLDDDKDCIMKAIEEPNICLKKKLLGLKEIKDLNEIKIIMKECNDNKRK